MYRIQNHIIPAHSKLCSWQKKFCIILYSLFNSLFNSINL